MTKSKENKSVTITDANRLVSLLADLMTKDDLMAIAAYDYRSDISQHYEPLLAFKNTLDSTYLKSWYPLEVMELCRWDKLIESEVIEHARRAFCCAGMLSKQFDTPKEYDIHFILNAICPLADSLCHLKQDYFEEFVQFLTHKINQNTDIEFLAGLELGKLFAFLKLRKDESIIREQLRKTIQAENEVFEMWGLNFPSHIELAKFANESAITGTCYKICISIREMASAIIHQETRESLLLMAERLKRCD